MLDTSTVMTKLQTLTQSHLLFGARVNSTGQLSKPEDRAGCKSWLVSAEHSVGLICPEGNSYRQAITKLSNTETNLMIYSSVLQASAILSALIEDVKSGLLVSIS